MARFWLQLAQLIERSSLLLLFAGSGFAWTKSILFTLIPEQLAPAWPLDRFVLLLCLPAVLCGLRYYRSYGGFATSFPLLLCIAVFLLGMLWADKTEIGRALVMVAHFGATLPAAALLRKNRYLRPCLSAFVWSSGLSFLWTMASDSLLSEARFGTIVDDMGNAVSNANNVGFQAAFAAIVVYFLYFDDKQRLRSKRQMQARSLLALVAIAFFLAVVLLSQSRTAALTVLAGIAVVFFKDNRTRLALVALGTGVLYYYTMLAPSLGAVGAVIERFQDETVMSAGDRMLIWSAAATIATQDWPTVLHGIGSAGTDKELADYLSEGASRSPRDNILRLHSHNFFIEWTISLGLLGVLPGVWLMYRMFVAAWRRDQEERSVLARLVIVYFVTLDLTSVCYGPEFWPAFGTVMWTALSVNRGGTSDRRSPPR